MNFQAIAVSLSKFKNIIVCVPWKKRQIWDFGTVYGQSTQKCKLNRHKSIADNSLYLIKLEKNQLEIKRLTDKEKYMLAFPSQYTCTLFSPLNCSSIYMNFLYTRYIFISMKILNKIFTMKNTCTENQFKHSFIYKNYNFKLYHNYYINCHYD